MYQLTEKFDVWDENKQPYSVENENHTRYEHHFGFVDERGYLLNCNDGKHFLKTPLLSSAEVSFDVSYTFSITEREGASTGWVFYFGYDKETRCGYRVQMDYTCSNKRLRITLYSVENDYTTGLDTVVFDNVVFPGSSKLHNHFSITPQGCTAKVGEHTRTFNVPVKAGRIGISKQNGVAEVVITDLTVVSDDAPKKETVIERDFEIPLHDGGRLPYKVHVSVDRYENGIHEIECILTGGSAELITPPNKIGSWLSLYDYLTNPYIRFIGNCDGKKMFIKNGRLTFAGDNGSFFTPELHARIKAQPMPYVRKYYTSSFEDCRYFVFGYDWFKTVRDDLMGDNSEFVFDIQTGEMVYYGRPLDRDVRVSVCSPKDKEFVKKVEACDIADRDAAVFHAQNNHYFTATEAPHFDVTIAKRFDDRFFEFKCYLTDAYFNKKQDVTPKKWENGTDCFGISTISFAVELPPLAQNLYHLAVECTYAGKVVEQHYSAFEVFDETITESPQQTAGLPMLYVGDGATGSPTLWDSKPDSNIHHYIDTPTYGPKYTEEKKAWNLSKLYKRDLVVWHTNRTTEEDYTAHPGTIKNVDYLNYAFEGVGYRTDYFHRSTYKKPYVREFYREFVALHPEYSLAPLEDDREFTAADFIALEKCFNEWIHFCNSRVKPLVDAQWEKIKELNPKAKRYSYMPYNIYATQGISAECVKWYGFEPDKVASSFDGFVQFEDYPFCCAYSTAYSAWAMATLNMMCKGLRIAPELYDSFDVGCPDGHVSFAMPPMSYSYAQPYQTTTQIYSYLYNSVYFHDNTFSYWQGDAFMVYALYNQEPQKRLHELVKSWGRYLENKPKAPLKTVAFLYRTCEDDDRANLRIKSYDTADNFYNIGATAMIYVYEHLAKSGMPAGFLTETLDGLTESMVDMLVLPSTKTMTEEELQTVRRLHQKGVKLLAVSDVIGLEDLFGVKRADCTVPVAKVFYNGQSEDVCPTDSEFRYVADGATALVTANDNKAVLLENGNCLLINTSLSQVGRDSFNIHPSLGARANISYLINDAVNAWLRKTVQATVKAGENCGTNLFISEAGDTMLLLTDYTYYLDEPREVTVMFESFEANDVESVGDDAPITKLISNGKLVGFTTTIKPLQVLLFKVK